MSWSDVINTAQTAWKIIESGEPSSEIATSTANAVPDVSDWQSLQGARKDDPIWIRRKNRVGWPFDDYLNVDVQIEIHWEYGATYRQGGAFIPNVWIEVPECFVGWSYDVEVGIHCRNPTNEGTDMAPIARLPVSISSTISCPMWSSRKDFGLLLFGDGNWEWT